MSTRHISIFLPRDTDFYRGLLAQMRRGFEAIGVRTSGALRLLDGDELRDWCGAHRPDAVFEMNRPRADAPALPRHVAHVCWVVDFNGRPLGHFEGSEVTYLFSDAWPEHYPHRGFFRWFGPGACEHDYAETEHRGEVDASFVGHVPNPWSEADLARDLTGVGACTFGALLPTIEALVRAQRDALHCTEDFMDLVDRACRERCDHGLALDEVLRYDVTCRLVRHLNRTDLADAVLDAEAGLALFGPINWSRWPRYAPHYRGWLATPAELRRVYATSRVNLHEGTGIHFRQMDAMSTGGLLFFRETANDSAEGGIARLFEPDVHYVPFTLATLAERLRAALADRERAAAMRTAAARAIRAGHTWRHRAQEVVADLATVRG
ncbi:MAG TPA: glycosyltransferase [Nannocystaceae bacterium]|nr:glycosyltransferase [Nannocystaceae bacterium]